LLSVMSTKQFETGISQVNFELEEIQRSVVIVLGRPERRMVRILRASMMYASLAVSERQNISSLDFFPFLQSRAPIE